MIVKKPLPIFYLAYTTVNFIWSKLDRIQIRVVFRWFDPGFSRRLDLDPIFSRSSVQDPIFLEGQIRIRVNATRIRNPD